MFSAKEMVHGEQRSQLCTEQPSPSAKARRGDPRDKLNKNFVRYQATQPYAESAGGCAGEGGEGETALRRALNSSGVSAPTRLALGSRSIILVSVHASLSALRSSLKRRVEGEAGEAGEAGVCHAAALRALMGED